MVVAGVVPLATLATVGLVALSVLATALPEREELAAVVALVRFTQTLLIPETTKLTRVLVVVALASLDKAAAGLVVRVVFLPLVAVAGLVEPVQRVSLAGHMAAVAAVDSARL